MGLGQLLDDWIDPTILAIEDAMHEGPWGRSPVALVTADAGGLPRENDRKVIAGYERLVGQGRPAPGPRRTLGLRRIRPRHLR